MQGKVGGEGLAWERDNISDNIGQYSGGQYRAGGRPIQTTAGRLLLCNINHYFGADSIGCVNIILTNIAVWRPGS